jgi:surface polysaccharide O-acyltransferase-like enzyme
MTETKIAPKTRIAATDAIRTLAISFVLLSHSANPYVENAPSNTPTFWVSSMYLVIAKMGVPLFMMVTGILLLDPKKNDEPLGSYFKKRINAIGIPFIVWAVLFYLYFSWVNHTDITVVGFFQEFFNGTISGHLWFIYTLVGIYLLVPLFRIILPHFSERMFKYFLIIWFISFSIIPMLNGIFHLKIQLGLIDMSGYSGFPVLGYYLFYIRRPRQSIKLLVFAGIMLFFNGLFGWLINYFGSRSNGTFYLRNAPLCILASIAVFVWLSNLDYQKIFTRFPWCKTIINVIGQHSLSIYLFHWMVLNFLWFDSPWFRIMPKYFFNVAVGIPVFAVMIMAISILARETFSRIPLIKSIWP